MILNIHKWTISTVILNDYIPTVALKMYLLLEISLRYEMISQSKPPKGLEIVPEVDKAELVCGFIHTMPSKDFDFTSLGPHAHFRLLISIPFPWEADWAQRNVCIEQLMVAAQWLSTSLIQRGATADPRAPLPVFRQFLGYPSWTQLPAELVF